LSCTACSAELCDAVDGEKRKFFTFTTKLEKSSPTAPIDSNMTTAANSGAIKMLVFFIFVFPLCDYNYIVEICKYIRKNSIIISDKVGEIEAFLNNLN